jgi:hypothetical protein
VLKNDNRPVYAQFEGVIKKLGGMQQKSISKENVTYL